METDKIVIIVVSFAIRYWSKGSVEALFLRHEGYLGAIGAFLKGTEDQGHSWTENYAGSSGFVASVEESAPRGSLEILEMDRAARPVGFFLFLAKMRLTTLIQLICHRMRKPEPTGLLACKVASFLFLFYSVK